jgi:hypothetical protein
LTAWDAPAGAAALARSPGANRFFYQPRDTREASAVDPHAMRTGADVHRRYLFGVLAQLDRILEGAGLTFWVTWELNAFDERFRGAVAVLYDDDQLQKPLWAPAVAVIFKTVGLGREPLRHTAALAPEIAWRMAMRDARNFALHCKRFARGPRLAGAPAPTFQLPLGASALVDVPAIPFAERPTDVFFAGSVGDSGRFTVRPRVLARRQMQSALQSARSAMPDLRVDYLVFGPFGVHFGADARILATEAYAARLAAARFALCPRGNVEETYRFFEAARAGCVPIGEPLPARWYFADAPYASLRRWSQLPALLRELRADERAGAELASAARRWWEERVAEPHVAEFMRARIPLATPMGAAGGAVGAGDGAGQARATTR